MTLLSNSCDDSVLCLFAPVVHTLHPVDLAHLAQCSRALRRLVDRSLAWARWLRQEFGPLRGERSPKEQYGDAVRYYRNAMQSLHRRSPRAALLLLRMNLLPTEGLAARLLLQHAMELHCRPVIHALPATLRPPNGYRLFCALRDGKRTQIVARLCRRSADVIWPSLQGLTPLHLAGASSRLPLLLDSAVDVNLTDHLGRTPLHFAIRAQRRSNVRELLRRGAKVDLQDHNRRTALHMAAARDSAEVLAMLLRRCENINAPDRRGWTPLHDAVHADLPESVRLLLMNGAKVDAADQDGDQPLHAAVRSYSVRIAFLLVQSGASPNRENKRGIRACDLADPQLKRALQLLRRIWLRKELAPPYFFQR